MRVCCIRHGISEANVLRVFSNRGFQHPLTPLGIEQCRNLADFLAGTAAAGIYASPLMRAFQSARIIAEILDVPEVVVSRDLREYDVGMLEGSSSDDSWEQFRNMRDRWNDPACRDEGLPGGESFNQAVSRFSRWLDRIRARHDAGETVLAVTHGGLLSVALPVLADGLTYRHAREYPLPGAGVAIIEDTPEGLWKCCSWNGVRLLPE